jgi:adenylate cyclase
MRAARLPTLLDLAADRPESAAAIEATLEQFFVRECAVLVVDMAGFTAITDADGYFAALLAIRRLQRLASARVCAHGGKVVKFVADNVFATFPTVRAALKAAEEIVADGRASAGVGYGRILLIDGDLYGAEVNHASRLGEDEAEAGAVEPTDAAKAAL